MRHRPRRRSTNEPNGIQPGSAPGNWSVGNRAALYKPHPKNIPFDNRALRRRSRRARRSLISLEVRAAVQECAMILTAFADPIGCNAQWAPSVVTRSCAVPLREHRTSRLRIVKRPAWKKSSVIGFRRLLLSIQLTGVRIAQDCKPMCARCHRVSRRWLRATALKASCEFTARIGQATRSREAYKSSFPGTAVSGIGLCSQTAALQNSS